MHQCTHSLDWRDRDSSLSESVLRVELLDRLQPREELAAVFRELPDLLQRGVLDSLLHNCRLAVADEVLLLHDMHGHSQVHGDALEQHFRDETCRHDARRSHGSASGGVRLRQFRIR